MSSVFGTLLGVVIVADHHPGAGDFHIDPFLVQVVLGLLILWAVGVNRLREVRVTRAEEDALMPTGLSSARGVSKSFPGVQALHDVSIRLRARLDPRAARRERRRQIDADQDHHRRSSARRRRVLLDGKAAALRRAARRDRRGHRRRASGAQPHPALFGRREHHAGAPGGRCFGLIDYAAIHARGATLARCARPRSRPAHAGLAAQRRQDADSSRSPRRCRCARRVLLLDEPTASLTPHETVTLFALLRKLRDDGVGILFVSHKLEEVQEICDQVTVLRDGRNACESQPMAGLERAGSRAADDRARRTDPRLAPRDRAPRDAGAGTARRLDRARPQRTSTSSCSSGEIVGLYGLVGAGRTELAKCIIGLHAITAGELSIDGQARAHRRRRRRRSTAAASAMSARTASRRA